MRSQETLFALLAGGLVFHASGKVISGVVSILFGRLLSIK